MEDPERRLSIGVAAHITAASPGGPRFDDSLTVDQRSSIANAIWLCENCARLIDRDQERFTVALLRQWKFKAEIETSSDLAETSEYRAIAATEIRSEFSMGEHLTVRALEEEMRCPIVTNVSVPTTEGWINLVGAAVRGRKVVGIDIRELGNRGFPFFQLEYLVELAQRIRFPRFDGIEIWLAVISTATDEAEVDIKQRLGSLADEASIEVETRVYRFHDLEARFR